MSRTLFILFVLIAFTCAYTFRYRASSHLIVKWLDERGYLTKDYQGYHQSILLLVWPIEAKVTTRNASGELVRLKFLIGDELFGGYMNNKITCTNVEKIDE